MKIQNVSTDGTVGNFKMTLRVKYTVKPAKVQTVVGSNSRQPTQRPLRNSTRPAFSFTHSDFLFMDAHWLARITRLQLSKSSS